jgi:hypothetical protein
MLAWRDLLCGVERNTFGLRTYQAPPVLPTDARVIIFPASTRADAVDASRQLAASVCVGPVLASQQTAPKSAGWLPAQSAGPPLCKAGRRARFTLPLPRSSASPFL